MLGIFGKKKATLFSGASTGIATFLGFSAPSANGPTTTEEMLGVNAVFTAGRVIAEGVAQMPVRLIEELPGGRTRFATEHWAHRLIAKRPNSWMTAYEFKEGMTFAAAVAPAAIAIKVEVNGTVRELLPVPPGAWRVEQSSDYGVRYAITFIDGRIEYFGQHQVFAFRGVSLDGVSAVPVIQRARRAIGLTQALEAQQTKHASSGGRPSGILSFTGEITEQTRDDLKASWQQRFGPGGEGGIAILDQGATFTPMSQSMVDNQFIESRRFAIEEIARAFRVQPIMLMQADKASTFASAEQMFKMHVVHTLMPWATRFEQALTRDLLPATERDRYRFDFDESELLRGDAASQADYFTKALGAGGQPAWMAVNEVREAVGLDPVDEAWAKTPQRGAMGAAAPAPDPAKKV